MLSLLALFIILNKITIFSVPYVGGHENAETSCDNLRESLNLIAVSLGPSSVMTKMGKISFSFKLLSSFVGGATLLNAALIFVNFAELRTSDDVNLNTK